MAPPTDHRLQQILAEGDFIRALARRLLGAADADDLVQDTWVAALQQPRGIEHPRSWLRRVTQRLAANRRRSDRRRTRREQEVADSRDPTAPSTADILACEEARQHVITAVLALDEPYRSTVLARFYECLDSDQIARRDGISRATVRSRLKRGLAHLRARLDAAYGGGREAWAVPLALFVERPATDPLPPTAATAASTKAIAAAALLALAALPVWWFGARESPPSPRSEARLGVARRAAGAVETGSSDSPTARRRVATGDASSAAARVGRLPYPLLDEPIEEVVVRAVNAATRQPVADAEVLFLPFRVQRSHPRARGDRELHETSHTERFFETFGSRTRTDSAGLATVHLSRSLGRLLIRKGDLQARVSLEPSELLAGQRVTVPLERATWLRFRLVDEVRGDPVVGQMVDTEGNGARPVLGSSKGYGGLYGPSDEDGLLRVPWRDDQQILRVYPWIVGHGESVRLEQPPADDRVIELRQPLTGSVTIELRTPGGELWPRLIEVDVEPVDPRAWGPPGSGPIMWRRTEAGVHHLPAVEVGSKLRVRAWPAGSREPREHAGPVVATGPERAGENRTIVLVAEREPCRLAATSRLADGSPPPPGYASIRVDGGPGQLAYPDEAGRIAWQAPAGDGASGHLVLRDETHTWRLQTDWDLESECTPGSHELGALTLQPPESLVSGVLDIGPAPWAGPPIRVRIEAPTADGTWERIDTVEVDPRASTAFAAYDESDESDVETIRVSVESARHFLPPEPAIVAAGTHDLRLRIDRGHPLRARVVAPASYARSVACQVTPQSGEFDDVDGGASRSEAVLLDFDGTAAHFLWPALPPGTCRLQVRVPGIASPLVTLHGVRVGAEAPRDPRLDPIDLRGRARTLTVTIAAGPRHPGPITRGGAAAAPSHSDEGILHGLLFDETGTAELLVGPGPHDVLVAVPGFRLWRAANVFADHVRVELEPCIEVPFRLAPNVRERLAGHHLLVDLIPRRPTDHSPREMARFLHPGERDAVITASLISLQRIAHTGRAHLPDAAVGRGSVLLSAPGTFEVQVSVQHRGSHYPLINYGIPWTRHLVRPEHVLVSSDTREPFLIEVDDEVLTRTVGLLARHR